MGGRGLAVPEGRSGGDVDKEEVGAATARTRRRSECLGPASRSRRWPMAVRNSREERESWDSGGE